MRITEDTGRPRLLLADDHDILREGLRQMLVPEFDVVETVGDGAALIEAAERLKPDVILTDVSMPMLSGIEAARQLRDGGCSSKVIFLTMHLDIEIATEALRAGAAGYVLKHSAIETLSHAIWEVLRGRQFVSPRIAENVKMNVMASSQRRDGMAIRLTSREREVLQLVANGHTIRMISRMLKITTRTVEFHKTNIMDKLGLRTTADLTQYAISNRIITIEDPEPAGTALTTSSTRARTSRPAHASRPASHTRSLMRFSQSTRRETGPQD